ncbi:MAG: DDE-type integrase/transposase/recombinase [Promethearchaeota archaeon]
MNRKNKEKKYDELRELCYNRLLSMRELASHFRTSERTIYRWLRQAKINPSMNKTKIKDNRGRPKKYPVEIFERIRELKEEIPYRSGSLIHKSLKHEFPTSCPSISTIRRYLRDEELNRKKYNRRQGYVKFERAYPNDLWQIDIAGVQTVGHLGKLYLIALLDDHSRFIVAAEYFKKQKGTNVIKVIRDAVIAYGRPNQILADNGAQFRNILGDLHFYI